MTEDDYIAATDLAFLRAALNSIREVHEHGPEVRIALLALELLVMRGRQRVASEEPSTKDVHRNIKRGAALRGALRTFLVECANCGPVEG